MGIIKKQFKENKIYKKYDRVESDDNDLILVYAVSEKPENDEEMTPILTIVSDLSDAYEYVSLKLYDEYKEHFELWCSLRELDSKDSDNWLDYLENKIDEEDEKYIIRRLFYKIKDITSILRMFNKCTPIGCSYEDEIEIAQLTTVTQ